MGKHVVVVARAVIFKAALTHLIMEENVAHHKQVYIYRAVARLGRSGFGRTTLLSVCRSAPVLVGALRSRLIATNAGT